MVRTESSPPRRKWHARRNKLPPRRSKRARLLGKRPRPPLNRRAARRISQQRSRMSHRLLMRCNSSPPDSNVEFQAQAGSGRFLTFRVGAQLYALRSEEVLEVIRVPPLARVPQGPAALLGIA